MRTISLLLKLADSLIPPQEFLDAFEFQDRDVEFQLAAWKLFKKRKKAITVKEVLGFMTRKGKHNKRIFEGPPLEYANVKSHFLDSGSFSHWSLAKMHQKQHGGTEWDYYSTDDFFQYMRSYAKFVKKYGIAVDHCANVDVIGNAKLTWRNQKFLEEEGIRPVPVVHFKSDLRWLKHYIDKGYEFIAIGGLVGSAGQNTCQGWLDRAFDLLCRTPNGNPAVNIHGFGITDLSILLRYPWFSVDSASWTKVAAYGNILVPRWKAGKYIFGVHKELPYLLKTSMDSPDKKHGTHALTMSPEGLRIVKRWCSHIGVPFGELDGTKIISHGVTTHHAERRVANLHFFELLRKSVPKYPRPFRSEVARSFGIVEGTSEGSFSFVNGTKNHRLIIYYSGDGGYASNPELVLGDQTNLMLTYYDSHKTGKPETRFAGVYKARKKGAAGA